MFSLNCGEGNCGLYSLGEGEQIIAALAVAAAPVETLDFGDLMTPVEDADGAECCVCKDPDPPCHGYHKCPDCGSPAHSWCLGEGDLVGCGRTPDTEAFDAAGLPDNVDPAPAPAPAPVGAPAPAPALVRGESPGVTSDELAPTVDTQDPVTPVPPARAASPFSPRTQQPYIPVSEKDRAAQAAEAESLLDEADSFQGKGSAHSFAESCFVGGDPGNSHNSVKKISGVLRVGPNIFMPGQVIKAKISRFGDVLFFTVVCFVGGTLLAGKKWHAVVVERGKTALTVVSISSATPTSLKASPEEMARCLDLVLDQALLEECLYNRFNARIEHVQRTQRSTAFVYPHSDTGPSGPLRKRVPKQPMQFDPSAPLSQKKKRPQEKKHPQAPPKKNEENNPSKKATSAKKRKTNSKQRRAKKPKPPATASAVSSDGEDTTTTIDCEPPKRGRRKATGSPRSDDLSSLELLRLRHDISTLRDRFDGFKYAAPEIAPATSRVEQLIALREEVKVLQSMHVLQGGVSAMELLTTTTERANVDRRQQMEILKLVLHRVVTDPIGENHVRQRPPPDPTYR
jgi:hypothetical protein